MLAFQHGASGLIPGDFEIRGGRSGTERGFCLHFSRRLLPISCFMFLSLQVSLLTRHLTITNKEVSFYECHTVKLNGKLESVNTTKIKQNKRYCVNIRFPVTYA
jgi:hypothetical protein